ncbi:MAG TPA: PilZ domain-containing protein [Candidatus Acidoferrum sp.]|nr:PilZ domain-containing protein [Candidatus Acidoferrum sp.]
MPGNNSDPADSLSESAEKPSTGDRRFPRIALPKGMWAAWYGAADHQISRVGTLSMGGIFICAPAPPPVGTKLKLAFEVPGGEIQTEGIVRNIEPGKGMGIQFTRLSPKDRVLLQRLMNRLLR